MTQHTVAALLAFALAAAACSRSPGAEATSPEPIAKGTFHNATGQRIGVATFTDSGGRPQLEVSVSQLPPGIHGFHLHAVGVCTPPDFKSAGGHLNPEARHHGRLNPDGPHLGDLPNLAVGANGLADTTFAVPEALLGSGAGSLFQSEGTALVIHAGPDDYRTDPSGNSGDRIACAVIERG
jgi:superoxide dismutase, Cu-Zn family